MKGNILTSVLLLLIVSCSSYTIDGIWQSVDYPGTTITIKCISKGQDGHNIYELDVDGCAFIYEFKLI